VPRLSLGATRGPGADGRRPLRAAPLPSNPPAQHIEAGGRPVAGTQHRRRRPTAAVRRVLPPRRPATKLDPARSRRKAPAEVRLMSHIAPTGVGLFSARSPSGIRPCDLSGDTAWPSDELTATVGAHSAELVSARTAECALVAADPSLAVRLQHRQTSLTLRAHLEHESMLPHSACQSQGGLKWSSQTPLRARTDRVRAPG
jgi:hypothetical protein